MIRRSPTRLELKLEDIQEFEYVQKSDRKKSILSCTGTEEAKKLIRQERIGYESARRAERGLIPAPRLAIRSGTSVGTSSTEASDLVGRRRHNAPSAAPITQPRPSTSVPSYAAAEALGEDDDQEEEDLIGSDLEDQVTLPLNYPDQDASALSQEEMMLELDQDASQSDSEVQDDNVDFEEILSDH